MTQCKICNKCFKNLNALSSHVTKSHKDITQQFYYDTYIALQHTSHICPTCGQHTSFMSIGYGYKTHCSRLCSNTDAKIIEQRHDTLRRTYGHPFTRPEILAKCKLTLIERYNVTNAYQIPIFKLKANNEHAIEKRYQTLKRNGTFKTSNQEDHCYDILKKHFNIVLRNYKTNQYPFNCDFYIQDIDCYVECNFHWTHNNHWFDSNNPDDLVIIKQWSNRSSYFDNAINTWTVRDLNKRKYAKENNLLYVVLWNYCEFQNWIDLDFELRRDY